MKKHSQKIRFALIGVINTALDFGILFMLTHLGMNEIAANYVSTATAFVFSFFANRSYTFKAQGGKLHHQIALFFVVTFFGLWVLQPPIIWGVDILLAHSGLNSNIILFIAKLLASVVTLIWNYIFYSRFVFKAKPLDEPLN